MKVPINKDSPLAMDDFDAAVQQRMERLQSNHSGHSTAHNR